MKQPILFQRIESGAILLASIYFYIHSHYNFLWFVLLLFSIDIFMIGYLADNKIGAIAYNIGHSYILPTALLVTGVFTHNLLAIGFAIIWIGHIGFDRMLGYGLKLPSGFGDTHLGKIGKKAKRD